MVKAIFFDIDGTLISFKTHKIPESTLQALAEIRRKGIKIFIATGRAELLIHSIDMSLFDGVISLNGQVVRYDGQIVHKSSFTQEDVRGAIDYVTSTGVTCLFEGVDFLKINEINDAAVIACDKMDILLPEPSDITTLYDKEIVQLIFFGDENQEKELLKNMPNCEATRWTSEFADIILQCGGKHIGIEALLSHLGMSRDEIMAFGDGENDITMLQYAGVGVAMGNASEEVKRAADYVTDSVDDDGVASALKHYGVI